MNWVFDEDLYRDMIDLVLQGTVNVCLSQGDYVEQSRYNLTLWR